MSAFRGLSKLLSLSIVVCVLFLQKGVHAYNFSWIWLSGSSTTGVGAYGQINNESSFGPGARDLSGSFRNGSDELMLYGGNSICNGNALADLWRYSISRNMWTWIGGSSTPDDAGNYPSMKKQYMDSS